MRGGRLLWRGFAAVAVCADGSLTGQSAVDPGADMSTGAITRGTGAYANARGVIVSKHADGGSLDTITVAA